MVVLFANVLTWLLGLSKPEQPCARIVAKPVLDTAERLQQWTHWSTHPEFAPSTRPEPTARAHARLVNVHPGNSLRF